MDNPQDQLVSTDIRLDLHMSKVGQSQLHLAGAKPKWALARGDYITTSTITEHGFGVYSFYLNPGDFLLLVISPPTHTFFFFQEVFSHSCPFLHATNIYHARYYYVPLMF